METREVEQRALIALLRAAYSGELAACLAYRGHAASVGDPDEVWHIRAVEAEEWDHRNRVGEILAALGAAPCPDRERRFTWIGRVIGLLCRVGGWFVPMYGAARLERGNIVEYEHAARHAFRAGRPEFVDDLLHMAEVEWEHELYFREKALSHPLSRVFPMWAPPPPREEIRRAFRRELGADAAAPPIT